MNNVKTINLLWEHVLFSCSQVFRLFMKFCRKRNDDYSKVVFQKRSHLLCTHNHTEKQENHILNWLTIKLKMYLRALLLLFK